MTGYTLKVFRIFIVNEVDLDGNVVHLTSLHLAENKEEIFFLPSSDKVHRTAVHNFFKEKLKFLVTDTIDGPKDSSKCIRVRPNSSGNQNNGRNFRKRKDRNEKPFDKRGSHDWPEHLGKFLRFHLYKENKDTQEVLRLIGKMLGVQPKSFGFSGTKDKRSVSTQQVYFSLQPSLMSLLILSSFLSID
ncbi:pseudouridylate synthase 7 homolog [Chenopodium quinoa]|uniref:pseudouridylate synthase 7 homolog n=1 Tax=Chenopodium quinoa TaxID=63459 RepID=UPI000B783EEC|nr:pseudouridylate synthase 7 homolog [Chenopodium quinoa]